MNTTNVAPARDPYQWLGNITDTVPGCIWASVTGFQLSGPEVFFNDGRWQTVCRIWFYSDACQCATVVALLELTWADGSGMWECTSRSEFSTYREAAEGRWRSIPSWGSPEAVAIELAEGYAKSFRDSL